MKITEAKLKEIIRKMVAEQRMGPPPVPADARKQRKGPPGSPIGSDLKRGSQIPVAANQAMMRRGSPGSVPVVEENVKSMQMKVLQIKDYGDFSVRKVARKVPGFSEPQVQYDVSKSSSRKSWYTGFGTLKNAKDFAIKGGATIGNEDKYKQKFFEEEACDEVKIQPVQEGVKLSPNLLREMVKTQLKEVSSYIEQERLRQEMNGLALEFLEKLVQKLGVNPDSLTPTAQQTFKLVNKELERAVKKAAADMFHLRNVVDAAGGGEGTK